MKRSDLARASVAVEQAGQPGLAELIRAASHGVIALMMVSDRTVSVSKRELTGCNKPIVTVIGDDDYASTGPSGWLCAKRVAQHTACAVIHASGATADTYAQAWMGARLTGSCALIETNTEHAREWAQLWRGKSVLLVWPRGGVHPVTPARELVH
jgi:hypothetical protein